MLRVEMVPLVNVGKSRSEGIDISPEALEGGLEPALYYDRSYTQYFQEAKGKTGECERICVALITESGGKSVISEKICKGTKTKAVLFNAKETTEGEGALCIFVGDGMDGIKWVIYEEGALA